MDEMDNRSLMQYLIENGADVNAKNYYGFTPLHCAVLHRNHCVIDLLIHAGANINAKSCLKRTALHFAISNYESKKWKRNLQSDGEGSDMWMVEKLLDQQDILVNLRDIRGDTPLMWAVMDKQLDATFALLRNKANPNIPNKDSLTPLHVAMSDQDPCSYITVALLFHRASINITDKEGKSAIDILIENVRNTQSYKFAYDCLETIAFTHRIKKYQKQKLESIPELATFLDECSIEVLVMKTDKVANGLTVFRFMLLGADDSNFDNPLFEVYLPIVKRLLAWMYPKYLHLILDHIPKSVLCIIFGLLNFSKNCEEMLDIGNSEGKFDNSLEISENEGCKYILDNDGCEEKSDNDDYKEIPNSKGSVESIDNYGCNATFESRDCEETSENSYCNETSENLDCEETSENLDCEETSENLDCEETSENLDCEETSENLDCEETSENLDCEEISESFKGEDTSYNGSEEAAYDGFKEARYNASCKEESSSSCCREASENSCCEEAYDDGEFEEKSNNIGCVEAHDVQSEEAYDDESENVCDDESEEASNIAGWEVAPVNHVIQESLEDHAIQESLEDHAIQESSDDHVTQESSDDHVTQESSDDHVAQESSDDDVAQESSDDDVSHESSDDDVAQESSDDDVAQESSDDDVAQESSDDHVIQEALDDNVCKMTCNFDGSNEASGKNVNKKTLKSIGFEDNSEVSLHNGYKKTPDKSVCIEPLDFKSCRRIARSEIDPRDFFSKIDIFLFSEYLSRLDIFCLIVALSKGSIHECMQLIRYRDKNFI